MSKWLIFMWILVLSLAMTPRAASADDDLAGPPADQELLLDVQINGQPIGKVGEFKLPNGKLMAMPANETASGQCWATPWSATRLR